ncbi:MAG: tRNA adenosine deaminase-associated protein [Actinomycetota bacterium]|nr:tRNA adenosine deaminase-associated protein [Actinomycetota bacterium]
MSQYFAAAVTRTADGWTAMEVELEPVEDLDGLADVLRDFATDRAGDMNRPTVLFVEEDDEYLAVVRVDGEADPRVFLSDGRAVGHSDIATLLHEGIAAAALELDEEEEEEQDAEDDEDVGTRPEAEPVGDGELLADLGTPSPELFALCAEEGMLPADVITSLCERAGFLDVVDEVREG